MQRILAPVALAAFLAFVRWVDSGGLLRLLFPPETASYQRSPSDRPLPPMSRPMPPTTSAPAWPSQARPYTSAPQPWSAPGLVYLPLPKEPERHDDCSPAGYYRNYYYCQDRRRATLGYNCLDPRDRYTSHCKEIYFQQALNKRAAEQRAWQQAADQRAAQQRAWQQAADQRAALQRQQQRAWQRQQDMQRQWKRP